MRPCVVNLITTDGGYSKGQQRLIFKMQSQSIPLITFIGEHQVKSPLHQDNPYAFKIYAIDVARKMGYEQVLWVDASVYPVRNIMPVFEYMRDKGIFLEHAGHVAGRWSTDKALRYFNITRDEANQMPMFAAGYCGFDFTNKISRDFFAKWQAAMLMGMFQGTWEESRHDMAAGSIIANQMGLLPLYSTGGQFFAYVGNGYAEPSKTSVFHLQGVI
jgi:hypothetical protein